MSQVSTCWTESLDPHESLNCIKDLATLFCNRGGTVGGHISELIARNRLLDLVRFELDYSDSWDVTQLIACRQALAFFQKADFLDLGINREQVAWDNFQASELSCAQSNAMFRMLACGSANMLPADTVVFHHAQRFIRRVLGIAPEIGALRLRFGPGATSSVKKKNASPALKLAETPTCSLDLYASGLLPSVFRTMPGWLDCHCTDWSIDDDGYLCAHTTVKLVTGSLQFVPKNAKTDRAIDTQPTINTLVQAGIGDYMVRRLKRFGLDLKDQNRNRDLARRGSIDGSVATVDLSSASDLISTQLVKFLLPEDWFVLLSSCRAGTTSYRGNEIVLEKFCSMGNGFTFPLESLIFWALVRSVVQFRGGSLEDVTVFGDDIICPTEWVQEVIRVLEVAGFIVNREKSCLSGPFRESCGGDYYLGINIRPYYCREALSGRTLFTMHNFFFKDFDEEACSYVRNLIPKELALYGPANYGDGHLHSSRWEAIIKPRLLRRGFGGVFFRSYSLKGRWIHSPYPGDYVTPLYSIYMKGTDRSVLDEPTEPIDFSASGRPKWSTPVPREDRAAYEKKMIYTFQR